MANKELANKVTRGFSKFKLELKKHSPEILVVSGILGMVGTIVLACKATKKADEVVEKAKRDIKGIRERLENSEQQGDEYTKEDCKKDSRIVYGRTGLELAKIYGPTIGVGVLSITSILAGHNILRKRNVALAAAYATVDNGFKEYRKRLIDRFGEELDKELKYNVQTKEVEETVVDEKGNEETVKKTIKVADPNEYSQYARFYEDGCNGWSKDSEHNLWFLRQQQNWANDKLKSQGYLFLNDVYDMLGIPRTKAGQIAGWIYNEENPVGDNFVDFGIYDIHKQGSRDFVNGYERSILLDFNVDGNILDLI